MNINEKINVKDIIKDVYKEESQKIIKLTFIYKYKNTKIKDFKARGVIIGSKVEIRTQSEIRIHNYLKDMPARMFKILTK